MSELKRDTRDVQFGYAGKPAALPDIEHSQPRQTLELANAAKFLQSEHARGGDPYNSVGTRFRRTTAA